MAYIKSETKLCKGCAEVKPRISFPLYLSGPKAGQLSESRATLTPPQVGLWQLNMSLSFWRELTVFVSGDNPHIQTEKGNYVLVYGKHKNGNWLGIVKGQVVSFGKNIFPYMTLIPCDDQIPSKPHQ